MRSPGNIHSHATVRVTSTREKVATGHATHRRTSIDRVVEQLADTRATNKHVDAGVVSLQRIYQMSNGAECDVALCRQSNMVETYMRPFQLLKQIHNHFLC